MLTGVTWWSIAATPQDSRLERSINIRIGQQGLILVHDVNRASDKHRLSKDFTLGLL